MLIALGFKPIKAASVALVANTAPVAFGAIAIPIVTLSEITGLPKEDLGAMVGRQTPLLALVVPLILIGMVDGMRGIRQAWPAAVVGGFVFAVAPVRLLELHLRRADRHRRLARLDRRDRAAAARLAAGRAADRRRGARRSTGPRWPAARRTTRRWRRRCAAATTASRTRPGTSSAPTSPYLIIIAVFSIAQIPAVKDALAEKPWTTTVQWPGLDVTTPDGEPLSSLTYNINWLPAAGTLLLISGLLTMAALRVAPGRALKVAGASFDQLKWAILTVASVLALAYVMNQSGQTITLGLWAAGAGDFFAFLSPLIGWLGVAVTGSDTSSNALFGALQVTAANDAGMSPTLLAAANSSGGVLGKMISPQNLAIGAAAVGMAGQEGDLFRKVLLWSVLLVLVMCVLVYLQSTAVLDWMVVK